MLILIGAAMATKFFETKKSPKKTFKPLRMVLIGTLCLSLMAAAGYGSYTFLKDHFNLGATPAPRHLSQANSSGTASPTPARSWQTTSFSDFTKTPTPTKNETPKKKVSSKSKKHSKKLAKHHKKKKHGMKTAKKHHKKNKHLAKYSKAKKKKIAKNGHHKKAKKTVKKSKSKKSHNEMAALK